MLNIIPISIEYKLEIMGHGMRAMAFHRDGGREISYFFDDKKVAMIPVPDGSFLSDDNCIVEIIENYCKTHVGVYADIFKNHSDKVRLIEKNIEVLIDNNGVPLGANVSSRNDGYYFSINLNGNDDIITGKFKSKDFSEVLEKMRLFLNTLDGLSNQMTKNIDELTDDKVKSWIRWQ